MRALVFPVGEEPTLTEIDTSLTNLQELVGGYLEAIHGPGWHAYVNEEGAWSSQGLNYEATRFAQANGWHWDGRYYLVGPVVFLGQHGSEESDVPLSLVDAAEAHYGPLGE